MKTALFLCLLFLVAGLPLYLLYWNVFRPVVLQRLRYRLFCERDNLRLMLISDEILGEDRKVYSLLERFCNKAILHAEQIDLAALLFIKADKQTYLESQRDLEIIFAAGPSVRKCFHEMIRTSVGAACANSPGILIIGAPIVIVLVTALWFGAVASVCHAIVTRAFGNLYLSPGSRSPAR